MDPITIALGLAQFAPTLMKFFGVGDKNVAVAQQVVNAAQTITGVSTPAEAMEALKANQQMQLQFQQKMLDIDSDLEKAYLSDKADARKRDAAFLTAGTRNYRADSMYVLAVATILYLVYTVLKIELNEYAKGIITLALGRFLGYLDNMYQYEFGTTRSSKTKDDTINKLSTPT